MAERRVWFVESQTATVEITPKCTLAPRVGIDLVFVPDVVLALSTHAHRYLERVYTSDEIAACLTENGAVVPSRLAARFAAKEAVVKALCPANGISYKNIEVVHGSSGAPEIVLSGAVALWARRCGLSSSSVSLTHEGDYASAVYFAMLSEPLDSRDETTIPPN